MCLVYHVTASEITQRRDICKLITHVHDSTLHCQNKLLLTLLASSEEKLHVHMSYSCMAYCGCLKIYAYIHVKSVLFQ